MTVARLPEALGLIEDQLGSERAVTTAVGEPGRTYEVRGAGDWVALCRQFPLEVTASRRHDWFRATGVDRRWVIPDWSLVAEAWDAVHLSVVGYLTAAGRALPVDGDVATVVAGWHPDSTIWLRPVPDSGPDSRSWTLSRDTDGWIPTGA
jgi:hypothetical protein